MDSAPASSDTPLPLPQLPGPKLAPFTATGYADIEFIRELGDSNHMDSFVWKVRIDGRDYALKMVKELPTKQYSLASKVREKKLTVAMISSGSTRISIYGEL